MSNLAKKIRDEEDKKRIKKNNRKNTKTQMPNMP